jgi:two-component system chemotaxis response regulator CheB
MINILIVDDSETEIMILKELFSKEKDFRVIGIAKNGKEAIRLAEFLKPNLITMDIQMPIMDGIEAIRMIMSHHPIPIVVISSKLNDASLKATFQAFEAGALSVLEKPGNISSPSFKNEKRKIIDTLRSMAEIKVIKRRFYAKDKKPLIFPKSVSETNNVYELIVIGSSVGGPQALKNILEKLPSNFPIPIVIVQHMAQGFIHGFAKWLNENTKLNVKPAKNNDILKKGHVYFAPDNFHLEIARSQDALIAKLIKGKPITGFCPSITALFQSVAKACGKNTIGILLTGMGSDGAKGMVELKQANAHTFIQDKESAVVFGMAGVAQSLGAVDKIIELDQIADYLMKITSNSVSSRD